MAIDRRSFLTSLSVAPALTMVGVAGCQPAERAVSPMPIVKALREVRLDDSVEPALHFAPLRRQS